MQNLKILSGRFIFALYILPLTHLFSGQQYCIYNHESELLRAANENILLAANSGTDVNVKIESGTNWKDITLEISAYVYGFSRTKQLGLASQEIKTKANGLKDQFSQMQKILGSFLGNYTSFSTVYSRHERAVSEEHPLPAGLFGLSTKECKMGKNAPVHTMNFIVKVTRSITFRIKNIDGVNSFTVSKGKIIRQYCSLKLNDCEIMRCVKYCSL